MENSEKIRLNDLKYRFLGLDGKSIKIESIDTCVLYVNEKILNTPLRDLFDKIDSEETSYIRGYSLLQELEKNKDKIMLVDDMQVLFYDRKSKLIFKIIDEVPILFYDDLVIEDKDEKLNEFSLLLLSGEVKQEAAEIEREGNLETELEPEEEKVPEAETEVEPEKETQEEKVPETELEPKKEEEKEKTPEERLREKIS